MRRVTAGLLLAVVLAGCGFLAGQPVAPLPPGTKDCIGLADALCLDVIDTIRKGGNGGRLEAVAWRVRCTTVCHVNKGEVEVTITWSDGSTSTSGVGWENQIAGPPVGPPVPIDPVPIPAVPPTCLGLPREQCLGEWQTSLENLSADQRGQILAINVACTTSCTPQEGKGTTTVVLRDGTRVPVSSWSYEAAP